MPTPGSCQAQACLQRAYGWRCVFASETPTTVPLTDWATAHRPPPAPPRTNPGCGTEDAKSGTKSTAHLQEEAELHDELGVKTKLVASQHSRIAA
jgi:hypothetical protein